MVVSYNKVRRGIIMIFWQHGREEGAKGWLLCIGLGKGAVSLGSISQHVIAPLASFMTAHLISPRNSSTEKHTFPLP